MDGHRADSRRLFRRAAAWVVPYWRRLGLVLALSTLATLAGLAQPYFLKILIDDALLAGDFGFLVSVSLALFAISLAGFLVNAFSSYRYVQVSAQALFDMRLSVFRHLQRLSPRFYARMPTGDVLSRLNNDVSEIQRVASDTLLAVLTNLVFLAGTVAILLWLQPWLFLLSVALLPASVAILHRFRLRVEDRSRDLRERSAEIGSFLVEAFLGLRQTVAARQEEREGGRFKQKNDRFIEALLRLQLSNYLASGLPGSLLSLSTLAVFLVGGYLVLQNALSLGSFVAFGAYQARLLGPLQNLMGLYLNVMAARPSLERVFALLDEAPEVSEAPAAEPLGALQGEIEFESVTLRYDRGGPVLDGLSFRIPAGTVAALVGPSGVGKSTVCDLLLRLLDPDAGRVLIDGRDVRGLRLADLRERVGVVEQDTFLWNASIEENIRYGRPDAGSDEVEEAARVAALHPFVASLPEGYRTPVGERGLQLSAGQRQRIALARAVLRRPGLLVLDEATSALDGEAERSFTDALLPLMSGRTTLILSHRLALVQVAQRVWVLERGRIAEAGTVESLGARDGAFRRLFGEPAVAPR
jgi:ATP-binding cassette subfamily B protein